jgi:hypothetical protein
MLTERFGRIGARGVLRRTIAPLLAVTVIIATPSRRGRRRAGRGGWSFRRALAIHAWMRRAWGPTA